MKVAGGKSIVLAVALFAALSVVVLLLVVLKERLRTATERLPERIAAGLRPEMLGSLEQVPRFDQIESFNRRMRQDYPNLIFLYVTKMRPDGVECCIHPEFSNELPDPALQSIKIERAGKVLGYLYLGLDTRHEQFLKGLISVLIPLLILAAFVLAAHVWRQERILATTRIQLAEKDQQLAHLERLSLAGQLAANLLHDLRKPVLHIRDEIRQPEQALDREELNEQVELFFQMLRETNVENLASASNEREQYLDPVEVLEASLNLVKYERGHTKVHFDVSRDLPLVRGYKYRLIQVFSNLLLNAYQALQGKGAVWVRACRADGDSGCGIQIEIADDGPGIAVEHQPFVFEPFYSAAGRTDSSGLGLYISRSILESMGGTIAIESFPGKGTTLRVFVPADEE